MRYYEVYLPGRDRNNPVITSNVRRMKNLPEGTEVWATITERDGTICETYQIPVENGRVQVVGQGKRRPRMFYQ